MEKKIDIAAILKDCPRGMELDSPMFEGLEFDSIVNSDYFSIRCRIKHPDGGYNYNFTKYGCWTDAPFSKCVIFPKGKTTWEGFVPPCQFNDGDVLSNGTSISIHNGYEDEYHYGCYVAIGHSFFKNHFVAKEDNSYVTKDNIRLATEEEKERLFQAIKDKGYQWNAETKTLEKLIEPKFKVGDRIKHKILNSTHIISKIKDGYYIINEISLPHGLLPIEAQDEYELVPNKFDVTTLKSFESTVLVRDKNTEEWRGHFFSHCANNSDRPYVCIGTEGINEYKQCIPYNGNEHLLGTTNECDEYYKNW